MPVKVTIPFRTGVVVEVDGDVEHVRETVADIAELFKSLETIPPEFIQNDKGAIPQPSTETQTSPMDFGEGEANTVPVIPAKEKESLRDAIVFVLGTEWGKTSRTFSQIYEALKVNALYRSKGSVGGTLTQLVNQNRIRRNRDTPRDEWRYTVS